MKEILTEHQEDSDFSLLDRCAKSLLIFASKLEDTSWKNFSHVSGLEAIRDQSFTREDLINELNKLLQEKT